MTEWWRSAVFYEIYVRSYRDTDGDGIGDLRGITERLDHLNDGTPDSLGVDALWLTPINPSPMYDFGYDVSDYCAVDPRFGTLADLDTLIDQAHRRGIRIILDLVPNHTSHEHAWFRESRCSRRSPKRDWYVWRDGRPGGNPPNNWVSAFGGPAWTYDAATEQYYLHSFLAEQPDLNYRHPEVRSAMQEVMRFWLDRGVDGFRIDVIHKLMKDLELRDNPPPDEVDVNPVRDYFGQRHVYDEDRPEVHDLIRSWRVLLDGYSDRTMVGEVYILDPLRVPRYYGNGRDELHLAFNFAFLWSPWSAERFRGLVDQMEELLPPAAQPTYVLSSHDAPRHRTRFDDGRHAEARARLAALMLLTLRGTPFLYYGEEIGMHDVVIPPHRVCDPVGKRFPGLGRDPERTPMQWTADRNAGFTPAPEPWLPVADDYAMLNVAAQKQDPASLFSLYRRVIWFRKTAPALTQGTYRSVDAPEQTFVYYREHRAQRLLVALNFSEEPHQIELEEEGIVVLGTDGARGRAVRGRIDLGPVEGLVVELAR